MATSPDRKYGNVLPGVIQQTLPVTQYKIDPNTGQVIQDESATTNGEGGGGGGEGHGDDSLLDCIPWKIVFACIFFIGICIALLYYLHARYQPVPVKEVMALPLR